MKRNFCLIFLLLIFSGNSFSQSRLLWSSASAPLNSMFTDAKAFAVDASGNNYSVNYNVSDVSMYVTYIFYAHDENGLKLWEFANDSCLNNCNDQYYNIVPLDNDGAIFVGFYDDPTGTQLRIKRIDENGSLVWQQYWLSPFLSAVPVKSFLDNNGDLIVGLSAVVDSTDQEDFALAKFDVTNGFLDWHLELPDAGTSPNSYSEIISSMTVDASDNIYGIGTAFPSTPGNNKNYVFRIDDGGTLDYIVETSYDSVQSSTTSMIVEGGFIYTFGFTGEMPRVEKRRAQTGSLIWSEDVSKDSSVLSNVDFVLNNNSVYVANNYSYFNQDTSGGYWNNKHYVITKMDTSGVVEWQHTYFPEMDSLSNEDGYGGAVEFKSCTDGLYVLSAQHLDTINDILILHRLDSAGTTVWFDTASVKDDAGRIGFDGNCDLYLARTFDSKNLTEKYSSSPVNSIALINENNAFEIFPNPAHNEISVIVSDKNISSARIEIYNSLGELIKQSSVFSHDKISLNDVSAGVYFVRLIAGNSFYTKKLILE